MRSLAFALAALSLTASTAAAQETTDLGKDAAAILKKHCGACHGGTGQGTKASKGGFDHVLSAKDLVASGLVARFKPSNSLLLERVVDGEMPPSSITERPTAAEVLTLRQWIEAGAQPPKLAQQAAARTAIGLAQLDAVIAADLQAAPPSDRRFLRYLSFAHLHDDARADASSLALAIPAVAKLIASLSWRPRLPQAQPVGPGSAIVRVDLRELGWSPELWEQIAAKSPYALVRRSKSARAARRLSATYAPILRADWLSASATRPRLYHRILGIPDTVRALNRMLDVEPNVALVRVGFNQSGISKHNRVIERRGQRRGSYLWRSYDFRGSSGRRSIFNHPLGPGGVDGFKSDGGELIFGLPNGMQAYMLVDAAGRRIEKAPTDVVFDPSRPDGAVENGISCIGCHALGIIDKRDEVRAHVLANRSAFDARDRSTAASALRVYRPAATLEAAYAADRERYTRALDRLGANTTVEPITALAAEFEKELDLSRAAAELGISEQHLRQRITADDFLGRNLGVLAVGGGTLKREAFAKLYPTVAPRLGAGRPLSVIDIATQLKSRCGDGNGRDCFEAGQKLVEARRPKVAQAVFRRGCQRKFASACSAAANLTANRSQSAKLLERGCKLGDLYACERLAARAEPRRAEQLLSRSCTASRASSCLALGDAFGRSSQHVQALTNYQRSCDLGLTLGCARAATTLDKGRGRVGQNRPRAASLYVQACRGGRTQSCFRAGELNYSGKKMPQRRGLAAEMFELACTAGSAEGCYRLAKQIRRGKGVKKNKARAKQLFSRACSLGKKRACLR